MLHEFIKFKDFKDFKFKDYKELFPQVREI